MGDSEPSTNFELTKIPRATYVEEGLTRLNPPWIDQHIIEVAGGEARDTAWRALIPQWLNQLGGELAGTYRVDESKNFTVLQPVGDQEPNELLDHAEKSLALVLQFWDGIVEDEGVGKHVIIVAASADDYYNYVCVYSNEGTHGGSGGMCLGGDGYTHILVNDTERWYQKSTITHEVAHGLLSHRRLPLWVEEGMVMLAEEHINSTHTSPPDVAGQRAYWSEHTLAGYWLGSAFHEADGGQKHAYELARHMVYDLATRDRAAFRRFVQDADFTDAGKDAALEHLRCPLGGCLPPFLQIEFASPR